MKIIVVENNRNFNKRICKYINQVLMANNSNWTVEPFFNFTEKLNNIIHDKEIKIYIIDIKLGGKYSGYDICRSIRESAYDWDSLIIISSIHNEKEDFISLRLSIFTYLSKHNKYEENLKESVTEAINILDKKKFLTINKNCSISINDICYILKEKNSKYCYIKTLDDHFRIRKSLKSLEKELRLRKVKAYLLVNDRNIKSTDKNKIIFENKIKIKID